MHGADLVQSTRGEGTADVVVYAKTENRIDLFAKNLAIMGQFEVFCVHSPYQGKIIPYAGACVSTTCINDDASQFEPASACYTTTGRGRVCSMDCLSALKNLDLSHPPARLIIYGLRCSWDFTLECFDVGLCMRDRSPSLRQWSKRGNWRQPIR